MDKAALNKPMNDANGVELHGSKLAHPSKTSTKDENKETNKPPGCKTSAQIKCDGTTPCYASSHDIEEGPAPVSKCKATSIKTRTETSNTNVSDHLSEGVDTSELEKSPNKAKVVKKGIAQVVKKKQKKGGWKYVDESEMPQVIGERRK